MTLRLHVWVVCSMVSWLVAVLAAPLDAFGQPGFGRPRETRPRQPTQDPNVIPTDPEAARVMREWLSDDPPRVDPSPEAARGVWHTWKTSEGYRLAWSLPENFDPSKSYNLVVVLHPRGDDFRWGMRTLSRGPAATLPPGVRAFRPDDMIVSIDGLQGDERYKRLRAFPLNLEYAVKFRDVMLELGRVLPVQRYYIYGMGGADGSGGRFALYFSAQFPALCDGVVTQGVELPESGAFKSSVPIVLLHGNKDSLVPLHKAVAARDEFVEAGHEQVRLRILRGFNHFSNPVRVDEAIDFLDAQRNAEAAQVLAAAERLLTPKRGDEYDYRTQVWFSAAYEALRRVVGEQDKAVAAVETPADDATKQRARDLMTRIDAEAERHIAALKPMLATDDLSTLTLDGGPWIGYAIAMRDDFRGVPAMERWASESKWDELAKSAVEAGQEILDQWRDDVPDADKFAFVTEKITQAYLDERLPPDMLARLRVCLRKADELSIPSEQRERFEFVTLWDRGYRDGLEAYEREWSGWRFEVGK